MRLWVELKGMPDPCEHKTEPQLSKLTEHLVFQPEPAYLWLRKWRHCRLRSRPTVVPNACARARPNAQSRLTQLEIAGSAIYLFNKMKILSFLLGVVQGSIPCMILLTLCCGALTTSATRLHIVNCKMYVCCYVVYSYASRPDSSFPRIIHSRRISESVSRYPSSRGEGEDYCVCYDDRVRAGYFAGWPPCRRDWTVNKTLSTEKLFKRIFIMASRFCVFNTVFVMINMFANFTVQFE